MGGEAVSQADQECWNCPGPHGMRVIPGRGQPQTRPSLLAGLSPKEADGQGLPPSGWANKCSLKRTRELLRARYLRLGCFAPELRLQQEPLHSFSILSPGLEQEGC